MLSLLRIIVFEWLLARIGLRWLLSLLAFGALALLFFVGLPTLLVLGALAFIGWRLLRKAPTPPQTGSAEGQQ